jgi:phenylpropionate dioxygenase-like ring-hydroxylating dioxygenase large terminal subunit
MGKEITSGHRGAAADLEGIHAALVKSNGTEFSHAIPMPGAVYHSAAFAEHERERIFRREWICIGRATDLSGAGSFITETVDDVAVIAVRQRDDTIKAFLNVCAHRFAKLETAASGTKKLFTCPYHAWSYDTAGRLVRAPFSEGVAGFDPKCISLREVHTELWEGFVYVSLAAERPTSPSDRLRQITSEVIGQYGMAEYVTVLRDELPVAANWKNMIENFIESYHLFAVHQATFGPAKKTPDDYVCGPDLDACAFHWGAKESDEGLGAAHPENTRLEGEWRRITVVGVVFPNHLITLGPDYLWSVTVHPDGPGRIRATWSLSMAPEVVGAIADGDRQAWLDGLREFMDALNAEDKPVIEALHRGTTKTAGPGWYHPIERNIWNFANYLQNITALS